MSLPKYVTGILLLVVIVAIGRVAIAGKIAGESEFHGDFRLRYESNSSVGDIRSWDRGVIRGRLEASLRPVHGIVIGARAVTGDPDNPRTTDVTLSDLNSNLDISLDRLYVRFESGGWNLAGGKFAKPFTSTELVWDGDVNLQGIGTQYSHQFNSAFSIKATATYFLIDENAASGDSHMLGGQVSALWRPGEHWLFELHGSYYDYELGQFAPMSQILLRGNTVAPDGTSLLSDFNLLDTVAAVTWSGLGERWRLRMVGNSVTNTGAMIAGDSGYALDLIAGRLEQPGDFMIRYGYAEVEKDAVLGMYSNDNIIFATNYRLHYLSFDYKLLNNVFLGLTHYVFSRLDTTEAPVQYDDWSSRTRLNLWFSF